MARKKQIVFFLVFINLFSQSYYFKNKKIELFPEKNLKSAKGIKYFKTTNGIRVGIKNEIIIKIKNKTVLKNLTVKKQLDKNTYLITTKEDIFVFLQNLYKNQNIIYAVPNFYKTIKRR